MNNNRSRLSSIIFLSLLCLTIMNGCVLNMKPIDVDHVQMNIVKGKTTMGEIEAFYGSPSEKGISKDGTRYFYYTSVNYIKGTGQDFTFYFDHNKKVATFASEYPGGNPFQ